MTNSTKKETNKLPKWLYFYIIAVTVLLVSVVWLLIRDINLDLSYEAKRQLVEESLAQPKYAVFTTGESKHLYDGSYGPAKSMFLYPFAKTGRVLFQPITHKHIKGGLMIAHDCLNSQEFSGLIESSKSINIVENGYYVYFVKVKRTKPPYIIIQRNRVFSEELSVLFEFAKKFKQELPKGGKLYFYGERIWCYHGLTLATSKHYTINKVFASDVFDGFICNNGYSSIKSILSQNEFNTLNQKLMKTRRPIGFKCGLNLFKSGTYQHYFYYLWCNCLYPNERPGCIEPWYNRRYVIKPILRIHDILNQNIPITESANMVKGIYNLELLTKYSMYYYSGPPNADKLANTILQFMDQQPKNIYNDPKQAQLYENIAIFKYRSLIKIVGEMYPNCRYLYHVITENREALNMRALQCRAIHFYSLIKETIDDKYGENNMNHHSKYLLPFLDKPKYNNDKIDILNRVRDSIHCFFITSINEFEDMHEYAPDSMYLLEKHEQSARLEMNRDDLLLDEYMVINDI